MKHYTTPLKLIVPHVHTSQILSYGEAWKVTSCRDLTVVTHQRGINGEPLLQEYGLMTLINSPEGISIQQMMGGKEDANSHHKLCFLGRLQFEKKIR